MEQLQLQDSTLQLQVEISNTSKQLEAVRTGPIIERPDPEGGQDSDQMPDPQPTPSE